MATETGSVTGAAAREDAGRTIDPIDLLGRFLPVIFLVVLAVVFSIQEPNFATERSSWFVLRQNFVYGILAVGMTFVILTCDSSVRRVSLRLAGWMIQPGCSSLLWTGRHWIGWRPWLGRCRRHRCLSASRANMVARTFIARDAG